MSCYHPQGGSETTYKCRLCNDFVESTCVPQGQNMWSSWAESAKSSVTQAFEKTGDVLSKAATNAGKSARTNSSNTQSDGDSQKTKVYDEPTIVQLPPKLPQHVVEQHDTTALTNENQLLTNLTHSWFNVLETTRASIRHAEEAINEQRLMFQQSIIAKAMSPKPIKRDPSLPLDVEALQDAEVVYITDRIITMGHPAMDSQVNSSISGARKLSAIGHFLTRRHAGRFMVWNLSEVEYDVDIFDDQVLTFSFPGSPSPPLGLLLKLFVSLESWLKADSRNVALLHCLTGKGRTSTVLAAFLCWMGEAQFSDIYQALEYIAACKQLTIDDLTIPSQRRYASYFKNMLEGIRPSQPPLMLRRIIMSEAPRFARGPPRPSTTTSKSNEHDATMIDNDDTQSLGCVPYIQVFKAGKLLLTAPASLHFQQAENELPFCYVADGNISFNINLFIQGDILVRARHLTPSKKRISMFRAAFHTGYAPPNIMRFTKLQLDGACTDDRFTPDFFLDFILEPIDAEEASKLLLSQDGTKVVETDPVSGSSESMSSDKVLSDANQEQVNAVQSSAEDSMLYGDSRFWDVITNRMKENATTSASNADPMWGPTVGRRRELKDVHSDFLSRDASSMAVLEQPKDGAVLGAFSISGELGTQPTAIGSESSLSQPIELPKMNPFTTSKPTKDSLLEALTGALHDEDDHDSDDNEIVVEFDNDPETSNAVSVTFTPPNKTSTDADVPMVPDPNLEAASTLADAAPALVTDTRGNVEEDWDALLSTHTNSLTDADLLNLEIDDAELNDLESFLSK